MYNTKCIFFIIKKTKFNQEIVIMVMIQLISFLNICSKIYSKHKVITKDFSILFMVVYINIIYFVIFILITISSFFGLIYYLINYF